MSEIPSSRAGFFRRLAYYAIGLAVGFVMLGMFQNLRTREHAAREAARPAPQLPTGNAPPPTSAPAAPESAPPTPAPQPE